MHHQFSLRSKRINMRILILLIFAISTTGCASLHYQRTKPGELHGKLVVQWIDHDKFIFIPDDEKPLTFIRFNKKNITPQRMYTDGGSIPRPLWVFRSYSPWGYAPAFIIHDWLFEMKHCKLPGYEDFNVEEAAWVMSEVMKTMMVEEEGAQSDEFTLYTMFEAVRSPIAEKLWETGECEPPPRKMFGMPPQPVYPKPIKEYVIEFP